MTSTRASSFSAMSVRDAIQSYRRSQYLSINAGVARASVADWSDDDNDDDESVIDDDEDDVDNTPRQRGARFARFAWPADVEAGEPAGASTDAEVPAADATVRDASADMSTADLQPILLGPAATENTPLLQPAVSFPDDVHPERTQPRPTSYHTKLNRTSTMSTTKSRRSDRSARRSHHDHLGRSTYGQTLFNSIAMLLGVGMLSVPLGFAYSGWTGGTLLVVMYGFITCYTAKILGRVILANPELRSYADIGQKAFGPRAVPFVSALFCLELFAISVALVTLSADSLHELLPAQDANSYKIWGALILIPTVFLPLSLLSSLSILGIASTLFIVAVVLIDGLSKREAPGSLWEPAATAWFPARAGELGVAFGLLMAGFSGHAVIPSLARDMADPSRFEEVIDWAFAIVTAIYLAIGGAGYAMFGRDVHDEVSVDLLNTPGYSMILNTLALWTFVISPLSKYALATRPVNITFEILLGLEERLPPTAPDDHAAFPRTLTLHGHSPDVERLGLKRAGVVIERVVFTLASIAVSICIPQFHIMMAFIGSVAAFLLCIIGPIFAKRAIYGIDAWDKVYLALGVIMGVWGTGAAFWPGE